MQKEGRWASDVPEYREPPNQQVFTADQSGNGQQNWEGILLDVICEWVSAFIRGILMCKIWWGCSSLDPMHFKTNKRNLPPKTKPHSDDKTLRGRTSLVAQWLRMCLPMQGTWVQALVREDPTCRRATKPMRHNYWACALEPASHNYWALAPQLLKPMPRAHAPQQEKPPQWEAHAPQRRVAPAHRK